MLHGDIRVNGQIIAAWTARRLDRLDDQTQIYDYECTYTRIDGLMRMGHNKFNVRHRYSDGAACLAAEVIRWSTAFETRPGGDA